MTWFAIYEIVTGRLESVSTIVPDLLPPAFAKKNLGESRPPDSEMWDEATVSFILRPLKILKDRFDDDLLTHPRYDQFRTLYDTLAPPDKATIRNAFRTLLGTNLKRNQAENEAIGEDTGFD